ncbi:uncharacterized protein F5147DRAFT_216175 [Suillus discolor]|uniref:Uncharacterized protein n=1 Tax=Suillus discolor TaxID=1912936 RepID=A0A9P7JT58_9AGAM|nr:uncharacterized protein F5147DRAFT_216175 [Suillus discolor]KAG2106926.1 hypothetical protein F5147DRAFT_216175 [Suillus discolor]
MLFSCAETNHTFPKETRRKVENRLVEQKKTYHFHIFSGRRAWHTTVRYNGTHIDNPPWHFGLTTRILSWLAESPSTGGQTQKRSVGLQIQQAYSLSSQSTPRVYFLPRQYMWAWAFRLSVHQSGTELLNNSKTGWDSKSRS